LGRPTNGVGFCQGILKGLGLAFIQFPGTASEVRLDLRIFLIGRLYYIVFGNVGGISNTLDKIFQLSGLTTRKNKRPDNKKRRKYASYAKPHHNQLFLCVRALFLS